MRFASVDEMYRHFLPIWPVAVYPDRPAPPPRLTSRRPAVVHVIITTAGGARREYWLPGEVLAYLVDTGQALYRQALRPRPVH